MEFDINFRMSEKERSSYFKCNIDVNKDPNDLNGKSLFKKILESGKDIDIIRFIQKKNKNLIFYRDERIQEGIQNQEEEDEREEENDGNIINYNNYNENLHVNEPKTIQEKNEIYRLNMKLKEKDRIIKEKDKIINKAVRELKEKDIKLKEKERELEKKVRELEEKDIKLKEKDEELYEKDTLISEKDEKIDELNNKLKKQKDILDECLKGQMQENHDFFINNGNIQAANQIEKIIDFNNKNNLNLNNSLSDEDNTVAETNFKYKVKNIKEGED